jgi:sec-independent protein translocase protein TatC
VPATAIRPIGHEDKLSVVDHLDELRTRLIICIGVFIACFCLTYWQNGRILHWVNEPLTKAQTSTSNNNSLAQTARFNDLQGTQLRALGGNLGDLSRALGSLSRDDDLPAQTRAQLAQAARSSVGAQTAAVRAAAAVPINRGRQPITLGVAEPFVQTFSVAGYAAILLALPFLLYQAYAFVLPAFSPKERRVAVPFMAMVPVLFVAGVAFGYFLALPRAVDFLQNFNSDNFDILVGASQYYKFSILVLALLGLMFQIPVGVLAVTRLGIITPKQLAKNRGYVLLAIAIIAAVATPTPDPVTMLVTMAPLVVLFEGSVLISRLFKPTGPSRWSFGDEDEEDLDDLDWDVEEMTALPPARSDRDDD